MDQTSVTSMETDVSSTTDDIPENQEVTGSNGNVEMVIIVEQVVEEESNLKNDKHFSVAENSFSTVAEGSPQNDIALPKTVTKSPNKDTEPQMSLQKYPTIDVSLQGVTPEKSPSKLVQVSTQKPVTTDSLSNLVALRHENEKDTNNSPVKTLEPKETTQNSSKLHHKKDMSIENFTKTSEIKDIEQKPTKVQNLKEKTTENSPVEPPVAINTEQRLAKVQNEKEIAIEKIPAKPSEAMQTEANPAKVQDEIEISIDKSSAIPLEIKNSDQNVSVKEIPFQEPMKSQIKEPDESKKQNINSKAEIVYLKKKEAELSNIIPIDMAVEKEASNDSQLDTFSDLTEKEHNKIISRELKSLINSAKESKIISECTQLTTKTRKSRVALDSSNISLNATIEAEKIQGARRSSNNSQMSNCSEKSEKSVLKRSMRSQNPEFVTKVKQFLSSVTGKSQKDDDMTDDEMENKSQDKNDDSIISASTSKKRKADDQVSNKDSKLRSDPYCWRCHWAVEHLGNEKVHVPKMCTVCPRSFHFKCLSGAERNKITLKNWVCPDCLIVLHAESSDTRSPAMKKISLGMLCELLKYALERMMDLNGVEPFMTPVDRVEFPDYDKYVVHPMDLSLMKTNITAGLYGSTEAFLGDAQWIMHNSIIFNTLQSKLTSGARGLVRSCRAEMGEIEACPECYAAAHGRRPTWFTDVCSTPHVLLWAKLKGFPHWPAKGMSVSAAGLVDVRFFGAHDRAWVPAKDCFLYSEKDPNNFRTKRQDILESMQEAEQHIRNISRKYGKFVYPPFKTQFEPAKLNEQLKMMIPAFEGEVRTPVKEKPSSSSPAASKGKSRSNSKSSKGSVNDNSDVSEAEDQSAMLPNNTMEGVETDKDIESATKKDKPKEQDTLERKTEKEESRKRRRSDLEEAVITILDNTTAEKRKRIEEDKADDKKSKSQEPNSSKEVHKKLKEQTENSNDASERDKSIADVTAEVEKITEEVKSVTASGTAKNKPVLIKEAVNKTIELSPITVHSGSVASKQTSKANTSRDSTKTTTPFNKLQLPSKTSTPKEEKASTPKQKSRSDKSFIEKINFRSEKSKSEKRRISKGIKSFNNSSEFKNLILTQSKKTDSVEAPVNKKDKPNDSNVGKEKEPDKNSASTTDMALSSDQSSKSAKDRSRFNEDKSLTERTKHTVGTANASGMPTISCVRSLSVGKNTNATVTKTTALQKTIEVTIEAHPDSSIFTPTSTDNIRNVKDAASKLQKLRSETEPLVGRVGVRAFARMTSPDKPKNDDVQVEIKAEPVDLDDADRQIEKMNLMNAFRLRPVNPLNNLREVRMNKVLVSPLNRMPAEVRPRAKKTFPTPKKPEDGQLNGKNSMVYIPIQPPMTQAPARPPRPLANGPAGSSPSARPAAPNNTSMANTIVNTLTPPLVPLIPSSLSSPTPTSTLTTTSTGIQSVPTIGQVPTTVHTVPLMTSVNGQWMFSLQPIMSVGGVDTTSPSLVNGHPERGNSAPTLVPAAAPSPAAPATPSPITHTSTSTNNRSAADTTSATPGELPRLQQRPALHHPLDAHAPPAAVPPPSTAGPLTAKLNQNAVKLTDFFRNLLEDSLEKLDEPPTQVAALRLQLEQTKWRHQQQVEEVKHNYELTMAEMRASFEKEKTRAVNEARRLSQVELETAVKQTKTKQWCANCSQEAQFYCCWNTSYCDYPCQRAHWSHHFSVCTQQRTQDGTNGNNDGTSQPESRLQPQPDNLPKSSTTAAPALTVGGKLAPPRTAHDTPTGQKTSIIVSMVEDNSGNQTMKCLGTYSATKPTGSTSVQVSPLLLNKQLMTNEETNKKVVTSGGYLIVGAGAGAGNASVVTPSRRAAHSIQYYT